MKNDKYKYCYQCRYSEYIKTPRFNKNHLCLKCKIGDEKGTYIPKDMIIGTCPWFAPYELSPMVKEINRLRGIDGMSRSRSELNEPLSLNEALR